MRRHLLWPGALALALALAGAMQAAGEEAYRAAVVKDWTVVVWASGDPECGIISRPTRRAAIRGGKEAVAGRGGSSLSVSVDPGDPPPHYRVSYRSGYPFRRNSAAALSIDGQAFRLMVGATEADSEWAWPPSAEDDGKVVDAMKRGLSAVITAASRRGTEVRDTFSLLGVTDALKLAERRCAVNP